MKDDCIKAYRSDWADGVATGADTSTEGVVVYTYPDGRKQEVKANSPVRNNNPGNLKYSTDEKARAAGAFGRDKNGFGVFPDWMTGKRAADSLWERFRGKNLTVREAVKQFTETQRAQRLGDLLKKAKGFRDTDGNPVNEKPPLSKLNEEQFRTLVDYNNYQLEGWLNGLREFDKTGKASSKWIRTPVGSNAPARIPQTPVNRPSPAVTKVSTIVGPIRPFSHRDRPNAPSACGSTGPGPSIQARPIAPRNVLAIHTPYGPTSPFSSPYDTSLSGGRNLAVPDASVPPRLPAPPFPQRNALASPAGSFEEALRDYSPWPPDAPWKR
jgi:hypothetical protein